MILVMSRRFLQTLLEIIYPKKCHGCKSRIRTDSTQDLVCGDCWSKIKVNPPPFCSHCGRHLDTKRIKKNICPECVKNQLHFDRAFSPCQYDGVLRDLIHEFKYKGKDYLSGPLSRLMTDFIETYDFPIGDIDQIVPIPLYKSRLREREFNQAQILGSLIAQKFDRELNSISLVRSSWKRTQTDLKKDQRRRNVLGNFSIKNSSGLKNKNILLIDDVLTTGATCSEAASVLKKAGAGIVFVLTLAN